MGLAAVVAPAQQQTPFARAGDERLVVGRRAGRRHHAGLGVHRQPLSRIKVELACRAPRLPPVPCASASAQFLTCTAGCASPRNWRTASITFVMPPRLAGWLLHSPPPSVLNGSLPEPEIRLPSATKRPPSPFLQKPRSSICSSTVIVKLS